ncbi:hypothetical protein I5M74_22385 [Serratia marcescens]|nr:hypothetical protein [Serratia marcescens]
MRKTNLIVAMTLGLVAASCAQAEKVKHGDAAMEVNVISGSTLTYTHAAAYELNLSAKNPEIKVGSITNGTGGTVAGYLYAGAGNVADSFNAVTPFLVDKDGKTTTTYVHVSPGGFKNTDTRKDGDYVLFDLEDQAIQPIMMIESADSPKPAAGAYTTSVEFGVVTP